MKDVSLIVLNPGIRIVLPYAATVRTSVHYALDLMQEVLHTAENYMNYVQKSAGHVQKSVRNMLLIMIAAGNVLKHVENVLKYVRNLLPRHHNFILLLIEVAPGKLFL